MANSAPTYGSDSSGLICGFLFAAGQAARPVDCADAARWLADSADRGDGRFIWLHFSLANVNSNKWLAEHLALPGAYFETLRAGPGSTRIELADDALIAVINDVIYDFSYEAPHIATLWMCVHRDYVVSTRLHSLRSIDRLRVSVREGERFASPILLLAHLLRDQADVLQQIGRGATTRVDAIEDSLLAGRLAAKRGTLGALRRVFVRLGRLLAPEPGALFRLLSRPPEWFSEDDGNELRSATEEFSSVHSDLAALQERIKLLQEEISAHTNEQTNRSLFLLTMATVLALPINIVAGLFGMNVGGVPLAENAHGFLIVAAVVAAFTSVACWFAFFRRSR